MLIGINLLREGLDLPEVSLVAILDADKEGFLRSANSLIQTIGRAARNLHGKAILYADIITDSMAKAISETDRRRQLQVQYNEENHITPQSIIKPVDMSLIGVAEADYWTPPEEDAELDQFASAKERDDCILKLEKDMREAAARFEFERAAKLRDRARAIKQRDVMA